MGPTSSSLNCNTILFLGINLMIGESSRALSSPSTASDLSPICRSPSTTISLPRLLPEPPDVPNTSVGGTSRVSPKAPDSPAQALPKLRSSCIFCLEAERPQI
ncbi:hypothetical protein XELAEV_18035837mg [Xenopus laevis]|uniref:Uncharacterized protein n=1 Tax=Xenopus laevis TaxID=8355 RepID=A0A974HCI0_XENLA|nr:hypothetical protein XELAEV_18035837mg [Xenopus laevis]